MHSTTSGRHHIPAGGHLVSTTRWYTESARQIPAKACIDSSRLGMTHRIVASASGLNFTSGLRETQSRKVSGRLQITLRWVSVCQPQCEQPLCSGLLWPCRLLIFRDRFVGLVPFLFWHLARQHGLRVIFVGMFFFVQRQDGSGNLVRRLVLQVSF